MKTHILHIDSSPMESRSVSKKLSHQIVTELKTKFSDHQVTYHDYGASPLPHLSPTVLSAFFTPAPDQSVLQKDAVALSDQLTDEFLSADIIVIGAPMWNLSIPSSLKAWIDHIVRAGKTFRYTESGAQGLVSGDKKVIIASSRGGIYTDGRAKEYDFQEPYLRAIFGFLGITNVSFVRAEGVSLGEASLAAALQTAEHDLHQVIALI